MTADELVIPSGAVVEAERLHVCPLVGSKCFSVLEKNVESLKRTLEARPR